MTDRKQSAESARREHEIRETEERLRGIADELPGFVFCGMRSPDGILRLTHLGPQLKDLLGVAPEDVISGRVAFADLIFPDDRQRFAQALEDSAASLSPLAIELRFLRQPEKALRWCQVRATRQRGPDGTVSWDGVALDITERKVAEERLVQALKMEAMGHLATGIAHDFNNLLAIMLGNAELLVEKADAVDPAFRAMLQNIVNAGERAAELTHGLLAFARREQAGPHPVDLNGLLEVVNPLLQRVLGRAIEIGLDLQPDLWPVDVDRDRIENAVLHLALNARDAMPAGGRMAIGTGNETIDAARAKGLGGIRPGPYVVLRVSDSGAGMPPEVAAHAIEPFFTTKPHGKGSGLGLSTIFAFVKQSGGHLAIESSPGKGTTIRIYLPRTDKEPAETGAAEASGHQAVESPASERLCVLLVEDDPAVRETVAGMIATLGYRVVTAPDGTAALSLLQGKRPPDLLLTDIVMPGDIDGLELARRARARFPALKVLLASGYNHGLDSGEQEPEPGVRLIGKPFRLAELAAELRRALGEIDRDPKELRP